MRDVFSIEATRNYFPNFWNNHATKATAAMQRSNFAKANSMEYPGSPKSIIVISDKLTQVIVHPLMMPTKIAQAATKTFLSGIFRRHPAPCNLPPPLTGSGLS